MLARVVEDVLGAEDGDGGFACGREKMEERGGTAPRSVNANSREGSLRTGDGFGCLQRRLPHTLLAALDDARHQAELARFLGAKVAGSQRELIQQRRVARFLWQPLEGSHVGCESYVDFLRVGEDEVSSV